MRRRGPYPIPTIDRFWKHVCPEPNSGCWLWVDGLSGLGYATIAVGSRYDGTENKILAHIFAYTYYIGPVPPGLELDHKCRIPSCCNPDHLEPVTHRINLLRGVGPSAMRARQTHCIHGHPFDKANTRIVKHGRQCRECALKRLKGYRAAQKAIHGRRLY